MSHVPEAVSVGGMDSGPSERARAITERRETLGMTGSALARLADVNRGHLSEYERGKREPDEPWVRRVERALDRIEHETGHDVPDAPPAEAPFIRIKVEGVYGAKALILEAPPGNIGELEAMVDRIMRRLQDAPPAEDV